MNPKIGDILERMRSLELELEKELESTRHNFHYSAIMEMPKAFGAIWRRFARISNNNSRCVRQREGLTQ